MKNIGIILLRGVWLDRQTRLHFLAHFFSGKKTWNTNLSTQIIKTLQPSEDSQPFKLNVLPMLLDLCMSLHLLIAQGIVVSSVNYYPAVSTTSRNIPITSWILDSWMVSFFYVHPFGTSFLILGIH